MQDCFYEFFDKYEKGEFLAAISQIIPTPDVAYDNLFSKEPLFPKLVNYIDAAVFGTYLETLVANNSLQSGLEKNHELTSRYRNSLAQLKLENQLLSFIFEKKQSVQNEVFPLPFFLFLQAEKKCEIMSQEDIEFITRNLSTLSKEFLKYKIPICHGWIAFKKSQPTYAKLCNLNSNERFPWYPIRYSFPENPFILSTSEIPLIFLEPIESDFSEMLTKLQSYSAIFIFETHLSLMQMLQFPNVEKLLSDPHHLLYILEYYPNSQFAVQNRFRFQNYKIVPHLTIKRTKIESTISVLLEALEKCLAQNDEELKNDTNLGNWLYQIAKRLLFSIQEERLGISRVAALTERKTQLEWRDPHKELPEIGKDLGPALKDYMGIKLAHLAKHPLSHSQKIRIAHIVPQIVDKGHAPSRLLENLICNHDSEKFEVFIIVTERLTFRSCDYPYNFFNSDPSKIRAPMRVKLFENLGISIKFLESGIAYEQSAEALASYLHQIKAEIAVFHGPDIINNMGAQLTDVPVRILFEHGTPPTYPGYDLAIVSSLSNVEIYNDLLSHLKTKVKALPFQVDARSQWEPYVFSKEKFGIPEESKIMTTISFNLGSRLGSEMCLAIAEILKRNPQTFYIPLGSIPDEKKERLNLFFKEHRVQNQIVFLGAVDNPSQYARSMHLYLNEFPFGSCLGILDAMASGCPVITMYDTKGPPQARYGGEFFGIDRAISSNKREDYVELACQLLINRAMYREWSEHAKTQYDNYANVKAYVRAFEEIVIQSLRSK